MLKFVKSGSGGKVMEYCLIATGIAIAVIAAANAVGGALVAMR
jgi:Flp pilus assembly pilin Flp